MAQATLLFLAAADLRADITLPGQVAPQADEQSVHVLRGERVEVPLRAHYGGGGAVTFRIVERPRQGTLSELRLLGDNAAAVVYQHNGARAEATDRFSYVARTGNGLVSSPAEVRLAVDEPAARLRIPSRIDFETITAGASAAQTLFIGNLGGGVLEGRLTASAPWKLGKSEYRVAGGETQKIAIIFQPDEGRDFVGQVRLAGPDGSERTIALAGSARAPITLAPARLRIDSAANETEPRAASVSLTNETDRSLQLHFGSNRRIEPIADLLLGPGETKKVEVILSPDRSAPVQEEILLQGDGFRMRLPVEAAAVTAPKIAPRPPSVPSSTATPSVAIQSTPVAKASQSTNERAEAASTPAPSLPALTLVAVRARRAEDAVWELTWPRPKEPVAQYRLEERFLSLDPAGELQTTWQPLASPTLTESGETILARIKELAPTELHIVRVTALRAEGATLWESPLVSLAPPREPAAGAGRWVLLLILVLIALVGWRWRARRIST